MDIPESRRFNFAGLITWACVAMCVVPSMGFNASPHLRQFFGTGEVNYLFTALAFGASITLLAMMPFLMESVGSAARLLLVPVVALLLSANLWNLARVSSHIRGNDTQNTRSAIAKSELLKSAISEAKKGRSEIPAFERVSQAQLDAVNGAIQRNEEARRLECGSGVGSRCRSLQDQMGTLSSSQNLLSRGLTLTMQADALDARISALEDQLRALGPLPTHVDGANAQLGRWLGVPEEHVIDAEPFFWGVFWEILSLFGPWAVRRSTGHFSGISAGKIPAKNKKAGAAKKRPEKSKKAGPSDEDLASIRGWVSARIVKSDRANRVQASEMAASYQSWCSENSFQACTPHRLGRVLKGELKLKFQRDGKKVGWYTGVALRPSGKPRLAVSN